MKRTDLIALLEQAKQVFVEVEIGGHYFDIAGSTSVLRQPENIGILALKCPSARELVSRAHFTEALFEEREQRITQLEEQRDKARGTLQAIADAEPATILAHGYYEAPCDRCRELIALAREGLNEAC